MKLFIKSQGHGNPLILLHGWGFNSDIWQSIAEQLASHWCVYQVDLPGHGRSPMCEYRLPVLTDILATELPTNAVWIGWSLGGLLTMAVARWYPASVSALVLISTSPRFMTADDWPHAMTPGALQQFEQQLHNDSMGTLQHFLQRFLALQVKGSEAAHHQLRLLKALLKNSPQPTALLEGLQLLQTTDLRSELSQIHRPALLCLGEHDKIVPVNVGKDCQKWWPHLQKVIIKSAAHIPFLSHPDIFMHLLQGFLNELPSNTS